MANQRIKLEGTIVGSWKVKSYLGKVGKKARYLAKCMECKTTHNVNGQDLRNGRSLRCKDCGIKAGAATRTGKTKAKYSIKQMQEKYLFKSKKKDASKRGQAWALSLDLFLSLVYSKCFYCGVEPSTTVNILKNNSLAAFWNDNGNITYNGIDRIDSSKGYTPDNVVTCCRTCNTAKMNMPIDEFKAWITRVFNNLSLKQP